MTRRFFSGSLLCSLILLAMMLASPRHAHGQMEVTKLSWLIPSEANAVTLVRAEEMLDTPIALREFIQDEESRADSPLSNINPDAKYVIFAAQIDLIETQLPNWEMALVELNDTVTPDAIADAEGGALDTSSGSPIVFSPRGLFYVPFGEQTVGIYTPTDRQAVLRWANSAKRRSDLVVSEYLSSGIRAFQGGEEQFVMLLDMSYLFSPSLLKPHVARATAIDIKVDDIDAIAQTLASVQGMTFKVKADTRLYGWLRFDFAESARPLERVAKNLLIEILGSIGAESDNFKSWGIAVEENSVTLRGPMTSDMMRKIVSVVELPTNSADGTGIASDDEPTSPGEISVRKTKHYYTSIETILDDLKDKSKDQRTTRLWSARFADKIDHMPILGVDPEMLQFGQDLSITLRNISNRALAAKLNVSQRRTTEAQVVGGGIGFGRFGYGGGWGGGFYGYGYGVGTGGVQGTSEFAMQNITRQEVTSAVRDQAAVWTEIENQLGKLRRELTMKYGVEF